MQLFPLLLIICLGMWLLVFPELRQRSNFKADVKQHRENLRKGGLIPKAPVKVHDEALKEIFEETPNVQLPRAKFIKAPKAYWKS